MKPTLHPLKSHLRACAAALWCVITLAGCSVSGSEEDSDSAPPIPVTSGTYHIVLGTSPQMMETCGEISLTYRLRSNGQLTTLSVRRDNCTDSVPTPLSVGADSMTLGYMADIAITSLPDTVDYALTFHRAATTPEAPLTLPVGIRGWFEGWRGDVGYVFDISQRVFYIPDLETAQLDDYFRQLDGSMTFSVAITTR